MATPVYNRLTGTLTVRFAFGIVFISQNSDGSFRVVFSLVKKSSPLCVTRVHEAQLSPGRPIDSKSFLPLEQISRKIYYINNT